MKNKTVKELNLEFEALAERVKKLESKDTTENVDDSDTDTVIRRMKETLQTYEDKIKDVDTKLGKLDDILSKTKSGNWENINMDSENTKCKECEKSFSSKKILIEHIRRIHPKVYECKICEDTFVESWRLELHMKSHEEMTTFNCDICEKQFHLSWRLKKDRASHDEQSKFCHYYNNDKNALLSF